MCLTTDFVARAPGTPARWAGVLRGQTFIERGALMPGQRVLVTGAGGFIGHRLVTFLKERGYWVRGVDLRAPEYAASDADEFALLDLRRWEKCLQATEG